MKISIIGPGLMSIPPKGWGAVETLIWDMRNALIELGHEVDIINLRDPIEIIKQVNSFRPDFVHIHYDDWVGLYDYIQYPCACTSHFGYLEREEMFGGYVNIANAFAKIQPRSGVVQWEIPVTISEETSEIGRLVDIDGNFSFSSGISFVASYQGNISAIDIRNGRTIWREKTSSSDDVLASRGKVFISDEKDNITAYEQTNGNISWKNSDFFLRELTSPKRLKSLIVLGDFQGFVHLISQKDGSQLGRERVSRKGLINVEVIEDKVLALDRNGKLSLFLLQ